MILLRKVYPEGCVNYWRSGALSFTIRHCCSLTSRPQASTRSTGSKSGILLYDLSNEGKTIFVTTHYMDEAERCTEVGFIEDGRLLAKASPRALKSSFRTRLLEIDVDPLMPALVRLRDIPELLGVSLRSGSLRLYAAEPEQLMAKWRERWPFPDLHLLGERWVEPDMEDVFTAYSQGYDGILKRSTLMKWLSFEATGQCRLQRIFAHPARSAGTAAGIDSAASFYTSFWSCL